MAEDPYETSRLTEALFRAQQAHTAKRTRLEKALRELQRRRVWFETTLTLTLDEIVEAQEGADQLLDFDPNEEQGAALEELSGFFNQLAAVTSVSGKTPQQMVETYLQECDHTCHVYVGAQVRRRSRMIELSFETGDEKISYDKIDNALDFLTIEFLYGMTARSRNIALLLSKFDEYSSALTWDQSGALRAMKILIPSSSSGPSAPNPVATFIPLEVDRTDAATRAGMTVRHAHL